MNRESLNLVICPDGDFQLLKPGAPGSSLNSKEAALPEHTVFAVPSDAVRTVTVGVAPEEVRHLRQALPFMLEESLLDNLDDLHLASVPLRNGSHVAAIVRRSQMDRWMDAAPEAVREIPWIPEALCLPWSEGVCTLVFLGEEVLIRWSESGGTRIEASLLDPLMTGLELADRNLVVYCENAELAAAALPDYSRSSIQWRRGGLAEALMVAEGHGLKLDLRQGVYAPRLPIGRWWGLWRRVIIAIAIALSLKTGLAVADYQLLKTENLHLREAIQDSYRSVNPTGAVVDVEKQLRRQLAELGAGAKQYPFTPLLVDVVSAMMQVEETSLSSLNYSGAGGIRLNVSAPDFRSVEELRERLKDRQLAAELESSNAKADGVSARLQIELKP